MLKRWCIFFLIQITVITLICGVVYFHKDKVALVKLPPASLAQWYKPQNKRQVWLHNMFKLRRELQAIEYYASVGNDQLTDQWMLRLNQHYIKIGEMVPEWKSRMDVTLLLTLSDVVASRDYEQVPQALQSIQKTCDSCHIDYRSLTAMRYRAADFSVPELAKNNEFKKLMQQLNVDVNALKIASSDHRRNAAMGSFMDLKIGLNKLSETCSTCHEKEHKILVNNDITATLGSLEAALSEGTIKEQGMALGALAVKACANCHANHRLSYDMREMIKNERPLLELLRH